MTSNKVLRMIEKLDTPGFIRTIGVSDLKVIGKNEEMICYDVKKINSILLENLSHTSPKIYITDLYNFLGQKLVKIQIGGNAVENQNKSELHLDLYFGPANIATLDKITGYELVHNNSDSVYFHPISYWKTHSSFH
jgi:hypothetical protein